MGIVISGVILAGGANKRFGGITKATIIIEGEKIISRIISTSETCLRRSSLLPTHRKNFRNSASAK